MVHTSKQQNGWVAGSNAEDEEQPVKLILVTGGVISGVGKGIISSSLGVLLKANGYRVSAIKIDPYINIDAGTFSPFEHGEVFVLDDGGEVDLDLGNYERFLNVSLCRDNNITTGKIYQRVIQKERNGDYGGKTVQVIPHISGAIIEWIQRVAAIPVDGSGKRPHVCVVELGGTIGDIEGMPYYKAFDIYKRPTHRDQLMSVHVSLLLDPKSTGEPKTKPLQNSLKLLRSEGLNADLLVCRSERPVSTRLKEKISEVGQLDLDQIIGVHDVSNIYKVPLLLQQQNVVEAIISKLNLGPVDPAETLHSSPNLYQWTQLSNLCDQPTIPCRIAIVGKYVRIEDAYASVNKALRHAAIHANRKLFIEYVSSEDLEDGVAPEVQEKAWQAIKRSDGILVPGGFGDRGIEGMIRACQYARENKVPFLGICLGMQCASIEFARNVCGLEKANSVEFDRNLDPSKQIVIDMPEHCAATHGMGATMRLGRRMTVFLTNESKLRHLYNRSAVEERHRHRYEVNPKIVPKLSRAGLLFVGMGVDETTTMIEADRRTESSAELVEMANSENGKAGLDELLNKIDRLCERGGDGTDKTAVRMEMIEMRDHPYFVGVQYHPEYLSHPLKPSPPFMGLLLAGSKQLEGYMHGKCPTPMDILAEPQD
uniref:CTP synthase n=1 Tax=Steinernema glaseri TaxID=37863 RepID=A0A1I7YI96_9BILA